MVVILLPNQLYDHKIIKTAKKVYLVEEPLFFYDANLRPLRYHKVKLAYLVTCMRAYAAKRTNVEYVSYNDITSFYNKIKHEPESTMFDPLDHVLLQKYKDIFHTRITLLPSPNFVMTREDLLEFHNPKVKRVLHSQFFNFVKQRLNILVNQTSTDKDNRHSIPNNVKISSPPHYNSTYHKDSIAYIESMWPDNPGTVEGLALWPTTHQQALKHLRHFLQHKFKDFGQYQDAIHPEESFLYHSCISPCLNNGLLNAEQVLREVMKYVKNRNIPINSLEGFLRQLIGWREYMRYLYIFHHDAYMSYPIIQSKCKRIKDWRPWYEGSTGIDTVDTEIKKCLGKAGGYAHHIIRLMVFLNIFLLVRIHPEDIYKWFMEICSIDAYDWVMKPNIYCMGYFYPHAMSKQYISTSNYIVNMSARRYKRDAQWDKLFHDYIREYRPPAYLRNIKNANT